MRSLSLILALSITLLACSKDSTEKPQVCFFPDPWFAAKMEEYKNCVCETIILSGTYKGQRTYEIRGVDPLCNGVNTVHKADGTPLFHSGDQPQYNDYLRHVKELTEIWRCSKQGK